MSSADARTAVGSARTRIEGPLKLTGAARYSMDNLPPGTLYAVLVGATVASGSVVTIDVAEAKAVAGVVSVLTGEDLPPLGPVLEFPGAPVKKPMEGDQIHFEGQAVAIVLAETLEAAEEARPLVSVAYAAEPVVLPGAGERQFLGAPDGDGTVWWPYGQPFARGDSAAALESAPVRFAASYVQPSRHHNPIETSGTLASWDGDRLTLWDSIQASMLLPPMFASVFGIDPADVHVIAPFTGGGFGCKGFWMHQLLAVAAAKAVGRPVKLHLRRGDQYNATGFQPLMTQRVELGADAEGHLQVYRHRVANITGMVETYLEAATEVKALYECPVIDTAQEIERVTVGMPSPMRCPNEGPGLWALESAINELAHEVGIDPLELRLRNYAEKDPLTGRPWSSKKLREAYAEGAELFGWHGRPRGGRRDGNWLIGTGMASAVGGTMRMPGTARVRLRSDGSVLIETDVQDIGTGLQTLLTQIAADEIGVPIDNIDVAWGDSALPTTGPIYGSSTMHTGSAVALACRELRRELAALSSLADPIEAVRAAGVEEVVGERTSQLPGGVEVDHDGGSTGFSMRTFGASFVEVAVDPMLGLVRLRRAVGSYSVGRIINPKTARSQMLGSFAWGWGKATMEASELDPTTARWLSKDLAGVHIPVNADIPGDITINFVDEYDHHASPIGAKGIGEFGSVGIDAAVAEAVFDAVGVRIRELPITPKRLLDALA
ncbi:MAG: xanthine dehydrogenase family protein molybdopterin-binding subunit [Actinobacteria bacterium]|nr:xanthine dehydrogenase family protein molybdopterin-binding subunit [Actinomycetota bacterium]